MSATRGAEFTLVAPDLAPHLAPGTRLPALERLCRRGDPAGAARPGAVAPRLMARFGLDPGGARDWPVAALTRLADTGESATGQWLRVDPVHLQVTLQDVIMGPAAALDLEAEEAGALVAEINAHLFPGAPGLEAPVPGRWYLRCGEETALGATARPLLEGRPVSAALPADPRWRELLNEMQMVMHASPVNAERERRGRPPVNSVWPWGAGRLPDPMEAAFDAVLGGGALARGLAARCGIPWAPPAESAVAALEARAGRRRVLAVLDDPERAGHPRPEGWLFHLEDAWFAPLLDGLRGGRLEALHLDLGGAGSVGVRRSHLGRWWRRPRPLSA